MYAMDTTGDELEAFVTEMSAVMQANNGLDVYKKELFRGRLVLFDLRSHLYAPLICLEKSNLKIQASPVALNTERSRNWRDDWRPRQAKNGSCSIRSSCPAPTRQICGCGRTEHIGKPETYIHSIMTNAWNQ